MKNISFPTLALAAVALFAACSSEDSTTGGVNNGQKQAITFSNYLGRNVTRGTIVDNDNIKTQGVGVFAMYMGERNVGSTVNSFTPNFMLNTTVSYATDNAGAGDNSATSPDNWTYNPVRYWPNSPTDYISFLAYGPQSDATTLCAADGGTTGDLTYIKHEVNPDQSKQIDLLRNSVNTNNMQLYYDDSGTLVFKSDGKDNEGFKDVSGKKVVNLDMIHACARVAFVVTAPALKNEGNFKTPLTYTSSKPGTNISNAKITVNKVALLGDKTTGEEKPANMTPAFYKEAYLNLTGHVDGYAGKNYAIEGTTDFWTNKSDGKEAFSFSTFAKGEYNDALTETSQGKKLWIPSDETETTLTGEMKVDNIGTKTYSVNSIGTQKSDYLFLIPQDFSASNTEGNTLYCYIEYTVKYDDAPDGAVKTDGVKYKAYGKIEKNFLAGGAYVIVISIGDGSTSSLNPINFTVNVENWADEEEVKAQL